MDGVGSAYSSNIVSFYRNAWCAAGTNGTNGNSPCTSCPAGRYNPTIGEDTCTACPGGSFGIAVGGTSQAGVCTRVWSPGYACPAGSSSGTAVPCGLGTYSGSGSAACTPCPAGQYGSATMLNTTGCSGQCSAGYYGDSPGGCGCCVGAVWLLCECCVAAV